MLKYIVNWSLDEQEPRDLKHMLGLTQGDSYIIAICSPKYMDSWV